MKELYVLLKSPLILETQIIIDFMDTKINLSYFEIRIIYEFITKYPLYNRSGKNHESYKTNYISYYKQRKLLTSQTTGTTFVETD